MAATRWWGTKNTVPGEYYNATPHTLFYTPDLSRPGFTGPFQQDITGRVNWQATSKHKISGSYHSQQQDSGIALLGATAAVAPEATVDLKYTPNYVAQGTWTYPRTSRLLFEAGLTKFKGAWGPEPVAGVLPTDFSVTDLAPGSHTVHGTRRSPRRPRTKWGTSVPGTPT